MKKTFCNEKMEKVTCGTSCGIISGISATGLTFNEDPITIIISQTAQSFSREPRKHTCSLISSSSDKKVSHESKITEYATKIAYFYALCRC